MGTKWHRFYCKAKEWYRRWFLTFVVILVIIWLIAHYCITPENVQPGYEYDKGENIMYGIYIFWTIWILTLLFLYNIIIWKLAGVVLFDNSIIIKSTKYKNLSGNPDTLSTPYNSNKEVFYNDIKSIKIEEIDNDRYNLVIEQKNGDEICINNLKKWNMLKDELKLKWINKVDFIPKKEEIIKVDPPYFSYC